MTTTGNERTFRCWSCQQRKLKSEIVDFKKGNIVCIECSDRISNEVVTGNNARKHTKRCQCVKCDRVLEVSRFDRMSTKSYRRHSTCKDCLKLVAAKTKHTDNQAEHRLRKSKFKPGDKVYFFLYNWDTFIGTVVDVEQKNNEYYVLVRSHQREYRDTDDTISKRESDVFHVGQPPHDQFTNDDIKYWSDK